MSANIKGKVVVITGASSGIGKTIAEHLASQGALVSLGARRIEKLDKLVNDIRDSGGQATAFSTDVTRLEDVNGLISHTISTYGKIDVMINNAGVMLLSKLENLLFDQWNIMVDTNLKGLMNGVGAVLPHFMAQRSGHYINIASLSGHRVDPTSAVYSATKFAVRAFSEGLRQEVKPYNIRTSIISPGVIQSELTEAITDPYAKEMVKGMAGMAISPMAIANAISYIIGQPEDIDVSEMIIRPTSQPY